MITEIAVVLVLVVVAIALIGKWQSGGKKGGMVGRMMRKYPLVFDLNLPVRKGRLAGAAGIQRMDSTESIVRYKTGFKNYEVKEGVPQDAILYINPPQTDHEEGIVVILPYQRNSPIKLVEQKYVEAQITSRYIIDRLSQEIGLLNSTVKEMSSDTILLDRIQKISSIIQDLTHKKEFTEKENPTIEVPTDKTKLSPPMMR